MGGASKRLLPLISLVALLVWFVSPLLGSAVILELPPCSHTPCLPAPQNPHSFSVLLLSQYHFKSCTFSCLRDSHNGLPYSFGTPLQSWKLFISQSHIQRRKILFPRLKTHHEIQTRVLPDEKIHPSWSRQLDISHRHSHRKNNLLSHYIHKKQRGKNHSSTCLHFFPGWAQRIPHLLGKKGEKLLRDQLRMASASCAKGLTLCHKFCTGRRRSFPTAVLRNPSFEEEHTERERESARKRKITYPMMSALHDLKESSLLMTRQLHEEAPSTQEPTTTTAAAASRERKKSFFRADCKVLGQDA